MPRKKKKGDDVNTNAWMDTYADTITLLLTFFILLYSISAVDSQKLKELKSALKDSLKGTTAVTDIDEDIKDLKVDLKGGKGDKAKDGDSKKEETSKYEDLSKKLNKIIQKNGLTNVIKIREDERGIVLQLGETILFDPGKANLKPNNKQVLETMNSIIKETKNDVLIEGHTDNIPMHNEEFASNWELSTARAVSVVRYFVETEKLSPTRFAVKGYGEFKPLVANDTAKNRAINRRVDILIIEQKDTKTKDTKTKDTKQKDNKEKDVKPNNAKQEEK